MNSNSLAEPPLTLRERFRTATRDAILAAAAATFERDGAPHARMEDIAARAGVAVGTVYNYFEDRAALVNALLENRTTALLDALDAAAPQTTRPAVPFTVELERFVEALASHFDTNRSLLTVLLDEERHRGVDARSATRRRTVIEQVLVRAEQLVARGIRSHALAKGDPATYAALLVGMVRGMVLTALTHDNGRVAEKTRDIVRVFMHGAAR